MSVIESALAQIKKLQPYAPGKPVEELERELGITNAIKLASNENPLGSSVLAREAIKLASQSIELYPDANAYYLKQKLAAKLGVNSAQITIGNGSNDLLDLLARTFLDANGEAIYSQYAFLVYALVTQACGATARIAQALPAGADQAYGHDLDAMLALVNERTRLVFIANPNNPTGTWLSANRLRGFLDALPARIAVVIDEAYFEYVDEADYPDTLQWLDAYPNLVVTRTFSKIYGLAGLRVGYALSSREICDLLNRVRQPFNANALALAAASASLDDDEFVRASQRNNQIGLQQLVEFCTERKLGFISSVGNFLSVEFAARSEEIYQKLLEQGVIVRPLANYGMPGYLRISIGSPAQMQLLMDKLDGLL